MAGHTHAKQERVVEAARHGLRGPEAVEFLHQSGYAMTEAGLERHLKKLGGYGRVRELIESGLSNMDVLATALPDADLRDVPVEPPTQPELFEAPEHHESDEIIDPDAPVFETAKMAIKVPADLYEAIRLAARAEGKSRNDLIVEILTAALSRMPEMEAEE